MKKRMLMFGCVLMAASFSIEMAAQFKRDNYNQIASMETSQQWNFTPKLNYYSKEKHTIPLPFGGKLVYHTPRYGWHENGYFGWGYNVVPNIYAAMAGRTEHVFKPSKYVNQRWRIQTTQRIPAVAEMLLMKNEINDYKERWDDMMKDDVLTIADRSGIVTGALSLGSKAITKNDRNEFCKQIGQVLGEIADEGAKKYLENEYDRILQQIEAISGAHMDDSRKTIQLRYCNKALEKLAEKSKRHRLVQLFKEETEEMMKPYEERVEKFFKKNEWAGELMEQFFLVEDAPVKIDAEGKKILDKLIDLKKLN